MSDVPLRRSRSLRSSSVLSSRRLSRKVNSGEGIPHSASEHMAIRPKKKTKRRETIRKRISLAISLPSRDKEVKEESEYEPLSRKISIDENVSFSHKEHVGKDEANQYLVRLLKLREERYMEMHQHIRENIVSGYMFLRPPGHMSSLFSQIIPKEQSKSMRRKKSKKNNDERTKAVKFWCELVPQSVGPNEEEIIVSPRQSSKNGRNGSVVAKRFEEICYFPGNLSNSAEKAKSELPHSLKQLPKGAPDYVFYVYSSEYKTDPTQILAVIPLTDVLITPISPLEFSVSYVNRLPNTHVFRLTTPELTQTWLKTVGLATQQEILNPFEGSRSRGNSISHSLSTIRESITPRNRSKKDLNSSSEGRQKPKDETDHVHYYKPICWDEKELKTEASDAFTKKLQLQEVYTSVGSQVSFFDPVRQGWRVLGGTTTDILTWCILTSDRNDKPNIDVTSFFLMSSLSIPEILACVENIWLILRNRLSGGSSSSKKRRTGFFSSSKSSPLDLMQQEDIKDEHIQIMVNLERRLFNFMAQWINIVLQMNSDNPDRDDILKPLIDFVRSHCDPDKIKVLTTFIEGTKQEALGKRSVSFGAVEIPTTELVPPGESVLTVSSDILAGQLTLMEIEYYKKLRTPEFLNLAWEKNPEKATGIKNLIAHYNSMGLWVATEILMATTPKLQAKAVSKFLRVAQKLFELRNYATCAQILSGVSNRAIQRLKRVHKQLDWKTAERYEQLNDNFDPVSGYANYRNKLDHSAPSIPFLAVNLRTLTLIEEGNPKFLGDDPEVISFARMVMYTECIASLHLGESDMIDYKIEAIPEIQNHLQNVPIMNEEKLFEISEQLEPLRGGLAKN